MKIKKLYVFIIIGLILFTQLNNQALNASSKGKNRVQTSYPSFSSPEYNISPNELGEVDLLLSPNTRRISFQLTGKESDNSSSSQEGSLRVLLPDAKNSTTEEILDLVSDSQVNLNIKNAKRLKHFSLLTTHKKNKTLKLVISPTEPGTYYLQAKVDGRNTIDTKIVVNEDGSKGLIRKANIEVKGMSCSNDCSNNGFCLSGMCLCSVGSNGPDCSMCKPGYFSPTCIQCNCSTHGMCNDGISGTGACICQPGWSGEICSTPVCSQSCVHGKCTAPNTCTCESGWSGALCDVPVCDPACVNGQCVVDGTQHLCKCNESWIGTACDKKDLCAGVTCTAQDQCHAPGTCDPSTGSCSNPPVADGSSCGTNASCTTGTCTCNSGWSGATCSTPVCSPTCGGHGTCAPNNVCTCDSGWGGSRCTTKL